MQSGVRVDEGAALVAYPSIEPEVQATRYVPYRAVLAETARRAAAELGWPMDAATAAQFAASLPSWPRFADTNPALERLAAHYRLGILSNVDDELLAETRAHFGVPFQNIVTAEQVQAYKPSHAHFLAARERIGGLRWLHAAQSSFHDIAPAGEWCRAAGRGAKPGRAAGVARDVTYFLAMMTSMRGAAGRCSCAGERAAQRIAGIVGVERARPLQCLRWCQCRR
jgi:2-haloalkanoic acid dehalogenase type II